MFKRIPKGVWLILIGLAAITVATGQVLAATAPGARVAPSKLMSQKTLSTNAWLIYTTNYGPFVNPGVGSGGFWRNPAHGYIYGAGMWVGATDENGNKVVAFGYNPNAGTSEFSPADLSADFNTGGYLSDALARVYLSTDPADYAVWPVIEGGKKVIKSRQDSYSRYSDMNDQFTTSGDKQLGVGIEQFTYAWNYADNNDIVFFYFRVHNISGKTLNKVYIGPANDCDIGDESGTNANDRTIFDYTRNLAIQFQKEPEPGWDKVGVVGFRYFESPANNTGDTVRVVDNQFSHKIAPDSALGMTAFKIFTLDTDPAVDEERYLVLQGINYATLIEDAYDETGADAPDDKRFLMSSGPFTLYDDSVATTCIGVIGALDTTKLKLASDIAQTIYDNKFELATPPAAPGLTITSGDKFVVISWDRKAETTPDPYWDKLDTTKKWFPYFPGSWTWLAASSQVLVDSLEIKTGPATTLKIIRGDTLSAALGTDTVNTKFSEQSMYDEYDFQGYLVYRARTVGDLADPAKREPVGTLYTDPDAAFNSTTLSFGGGAGYFYDKADGIKIMRNFDANSYYTPDSAVVLTKYDTLGTDRGLVYSLRDDDVINGFGWYYGVSAYDYQSNVYFTHKCPTTLASNPTENATYGVAQKTMVDYQAPVVRYTVTGGSDIKTGGTLDYEYKLTLVPKNVSNDTFRLLWNPITKASIAGTNYPVYHAELRDMRPVNGDSLLQTIDFRPDFTMVGTDPVATYNGTFDDEIPFGGVVFNADYKYDYTLAKVDTVSVTGVYPADSIFAQAYGPLNTLFTASANAWQWRGSDFEIRWRDSVGTVGTNPAGSILCATVWDITNNVEVPLEPVVTKANMTMSSWCFNPAATAGRAYLDSVNATARLGMYIGGVVLFFNRANGATLRNISTLWNLRPHTGDVWTVRCSGPGNPAQGGTVTFITTKASQKAALSASLLDKIKVVPNPYLVRASWDVSKNYPNIYFVNLPSKCTIRIYNLAGDLIRVLNHESTFDDNNGTEKWDMLSSYDKRPASGVYLFQIDAPGIGTKLGKFAVIK
ncbi:MAG: hypothetical protein A2024_01880 [Candidatus Edwardsbacteria bacterium GWF2_54_11]|uniref:Secretion system C-terminal sorting domain-containing protein n=1 Tax=Candidatus Edwardsbacteria bacterium GWF2_54_11 TaxID=1817851 RepID=A0A1F5RF25_9BACT|nr:MAG: hypothetical protein A2024_01880 [Candidatus Edwardsbacteria bacterium GWF2_54_11]